MCLGRSGVIGVEGVRPLRGSKGRPQGEDTGIQQGRLSLIKSLICQVVFDLAKRNQRDFNHDIDYTDIELEEKIIWLCHII